MSGYWAVDLTAEAALFTGFSPGRATFRVSRTFEPAGRVVDIGLGLPVGYLRDDVVPELTWWSGGSWHSYSGEALNAQQLTTTACRSMRPRVLCP